jgi:hypothetical protein
MVVRTLLNCLIIKGLLVLFRKSADPDPYSFPRWIRIRIDIFFLGWIGTRAKGMLSETLGVRRGGGGRG